MVSSITEYNGNPIIELKENEEDQYGFRFGKKKAKLILDHLKEIKEFAGE